jgi:hypothetical protein
MAKEEGVLVRINSDAHSSFDFTNLQYGVGQARRGCREEKDDGSILARSQAAASSQAHHVKAPPGQQHFRCLLSQARGQEDP